MRIHFHFHQPQVRWPTFHLHQLAAVGMQPVRQGVRASSSRVTSARVPTVAKQARVLRSKQLSTVPHSVANTKHWPMMGTKRHPRPESCGFLHLPHTQNKRRSKQHGSHDINPVEISLKPSDQAYRSEKWIHLAREEYVVRLSTNWSRWRGRWCFLTLSVSREEDAPVSTKPHIARGRRR